MIEPLALLLCQRAVVAAQLAQRLEALRYRTGIIANPSELAIAAEGQRAMVVFVDVDGVNEAVLDAIAQLRTSPGTSHIPVIAFARELDDATQARLMQLGTSCVVVESAVMEHLPQLLNRALDIP